MSVSTSLALNARPDVVHEDSVPNTIASSTMLTKKPLDYRSESVPICMYRRAEFRKYGVNMRKNKVGFGRRWHPHS